MPSANHPGGPGTKGGSYKGPVLETEPGFTFPDSNIRHGTASGHAKHGKMGTPPCEPCRIAKSNYDARQLDIPENTQRNRLASRAQAQAFKDLRKAHEEEYREMYEAHRDALLAEAGLERRQRQSFKKADVSTW